MYEGLASYFLPPGMLTYFEVTDFTEETVTSKNLLYSTILNIYLDERDNRTPDMKGSVSNGFSEESCMMDFPTRDKKPFCTSAAVVGPCRTGRHASLI